MRVAEDDVEDPVPEGTVVGALVLVDELVNDVTEELELEVVNNTGVDAVVEDVKGRTDEDDELAIVMGTPTGVVAAPTLASGHELSVPAVTSTTPENDKAPKESSTPHPTESPGNTTSSVHEISPAAF